MNPEPTPTSPPRSEAHPFDAISAVLGILACLAGLLVVTASADIFAADDAGVWVAAAAIAIGTALLPWGRRARH